MEYPYLEFVDITQSISIGQWKMEYPYLDFVDITPFFIALLRYFVLCQQTLDKDIPFFITL
jgi:hypothetical protein